MPISKRRKKKDGTIARFKKDRILADIEENHIRAGVSLQDLINVVAWQEHEQGRSQKVNDIIEKHNKENQDGGQ